MFVFWLFLYFWSGPALVGKTPGKAVVDRLHGLVLQHRIEA